MNFEFSRALVGNRLVSISIREEGKNFVVFSETNPSILFFCPITTEYGEHFKAIEESLKESSEDIIAIRLVQSETETKLFCGLDSSFTIDLEEASSKQWKSHLSRHFDRITEKSNSLKKENNQLITITTELSKDNERLNQQLEWKTKEIELLRLLLQKSDEKMKSQHQQHCESCGCDKEDEEMTLGEAPETSVSLSPLKGPQMTDPQEMEGNIKAESLNSQSAQTPIQNQIVSDKKSEDLLWGVAQYIFCQLCPDQASDFGLDSHNFFTDFKGMENHFLNAHVDKEKRNCSACPSETLHDIAGHVQQHVQRVYACEFCGKRGRKHFLKSHIRTHTGERPYRCETCSRCFADASTLRRHRLVHSGVKAHSCPICGVSIARKDNVKVHIRSHGRDASTSSNS